MPTTNRSLRGPLHTFHNLLHFLPFHELGQQDSAFTKSHLLCNCLELSVVLRSVLAQDDGPASGSFSFTETALNSTFRALARWTPVRVNGRQG
jgi:hypothetical protein